MSSKEKPRTPSRGIHAIQDYFFMNPGFPRGPILPEAPWFNLHVSRISVECPYCGASLTPALFVEHCGHVVLGYLFADDLDTAHCIVTLPWVNGLERQTVVDYIWRLMLEVGPFPKRPHVRVFKATPAGDQRLFALFGPDLDRPKLDEEVARLTEETNDWNNENYFPLAPGERWAKVE